MADKKLNEVPVVSDIVTIFGKRSNGEVVQIDKSNLATLLGALRLLLFHSISFRSKINCSKYNKRASAKECKNMTNYWVHFSILLKYD